MKACFAILFSFLFLLTTMQPTAFYLLYKINQKSITEQYCINKEVKNSCCKGSCHLNKTIAKAENENDKNPVSTLTFKLKEVESICFPLPSMTFGYTSISKEITFRHYATSIYSGIATALIKPPCHLG